MFRSSNFTSKISSFLLLLIACQLCLANGAVVYDYGSEVCVLEDNSFNRICDSHEFGEFLYVNVISCGGEIGNYVLHSVSHDVIIPSPDHVTCNSRFGSPNCPQSVDDLLLMPFTGGAEICSSYNCTTNAPCYCQLAYRGTKTYCGDSKGPEMTILSSSIGLVTRQTHNSQFRDLIFSNSSSAPVEKLSDICHLKTTPTTIIISCNRIYTSSINLMSKHFNNVYHFTSNTFHLDIPKAFKNHAMKFSLLFTTGGRYYFQQFLKDSTNYCDDKPCLYCKEAWYNWDCLSHGEQARFGIVMFLILLSFFLLVPFSIILLLGIVYFAQASYNKAKYYAFRNSMLKKESYVRSSDLARFNSNYSPLPSRSIAISALLCLCLCLAFVTATCDIGQTANALVQSCSIDAAGNQVCVMSSQINFSLDYPGQTLCLSVMDNNVIPPLLIGTVSITYMMYTCVGIPNLMYFTNSYGIQDQSNQNCYLGDNCNDSNCASINDNGFTDRQAMGELTSSDLLSFPGQTFCLREPHVPTDLCAFSNPGCVFTGYWLKPNSYNFRGVYDFPSQICGAVLEINMDLPNLNQTTVPAFYQAPSSVTFNSSSSSSSAILTIDSFSGENSCYDLSRIPAVVSPDMKFVHEVSDPLYPEPNKVGDIQCSDLDCWEGSSPNLQISYDLAHIGSATIANGANYVYNLPGLDYCTQPMSLICDDLPYSPDGVNTLIPGINPDNPGYQQLTSINSVCPNGPAISANIIIQNYTFERTVITCEFNLELDHITGCYDCDTCAYAYINVISTSSCSASITGVGLVPSIASIVIQEPSIVVPFCSSNKYLDGHMIFTSGAFSDNVDIVGSLQDPVIISTPYFFNYTDGYDVHYDDSSSDGVLKGFSEFWDDLFSGHWWSYILFLIVALIVFAFIVFCAFEMITVVIPYCFAAAIMKPKTN